MEEKYDDIQGPREATDVPHFEGYSEQRYSSCAFWIYRLLVFRGAFSVFDPIKDANVGDVLHVKSECLEHYLFCDVRANFWIDTAPSSVSAIGVWNRTLLIRMGSPRRGFSAHRSGFVSRTCILAILASKGKELPPGTIEVMIRWGGWQAVTGAKTLLRIYARKVIDKYLDPYGLSLGYDLSDKAWELKRKEYLGLPRHPKVPVIDRGRNSLPLQIRVHVWRCRRWMDFQKALNRACAKIMAAAVADRDIMPVHRYRQGRRALSMYVSEHSELEVVQEYTDLLAMRAHVWASCVRDTIDFCETAFFKDGIVARPDKYMKGKLFVGFLKDVHIGHIRMDGTVDRDGWEGDLSDAGWDCEGEVCMARNEDSECKRMMSYQMQAFVGQLPMKCAPRGTMPGGVSHSQRSGKFTSFVYVQVMTPSLPRQLLRLHLRTSVEVTRHEEATTCRDAAMMYLTDGRCREKNLSGMPCVDWDSFKHTKPVKDFKLEVKEYNAAENTFLAHDGFLDRMDRKVASARMLKPHERIRFGVAETVIDRAT